MANQKISALASGNPAQNGDLIPIDRSGSNFSLTAQSIAALSPSPETVQSGGGYAGMVYMPPNTLLGYYQTDVYNASSLGGGSVWGFQFDYAGIKGINNASLNVFATVGTNTMYCGIYSIDRGTLLQEFKFPMTGTGLIKIALGATLNLPPGSYWYVWGVDTANAGDQVTAYTGGGAYTGLRGGVQRFGYKGSCIVAGHLVASIPAGAWGVDSGQNIPVLFLEP